MLVSAVLFVQVVLALHILSVVAAFGVLFAYPLFMGVGARLQPAAMPWFHRMQQAVSRWLVSPGLLAVVVFGVILASEDHVWKVFYVQWGIGAALVIGALEGAFLVPRTGRLAELAERDLAGVPGGAEATWSPDYLALRRQAEIATGVISAIVIVTIYLMAVQAGS